MPAKLEMLKFSLWREAVAVDGRDLGVRADYFTVRYSQ
jgi:hypothetical protein